VELEAAARVAETLGAAAHRVVKIDLRVFGHSALTDDIEVPKGRDEAVMNAGIPVTYVPARNTIFLSFALAWAEVLESSDIFIGVNALDYSGYPDCRPEFIEAFERMVEGADRAVGRRTRGAVWIDAQLLRSGCGGTAVRPVRFLPAPGQGFPRGRSRRPGVISNEDR
jgi:7-cyano-7-deazaguanine synthase